MTPISFLLCNYNALKYFRFCYESLRRNLDSRHEIVLLDDGSSDGSAQWLHSLGDPHAVVHCSPENVGIAYSYNTAADLASNEHICVLHTDMYVPPGFDAAVMRGMERFDFLAAYRAEPSVYPPSVDKASADFGERLEDFNEAGFLAWNRENETRNAGRTFPALFFPWMTTKTLFRRVGGVDLLFLKYMVDDDDLYLRVKLSGARIGQVRDACVYHFGSRSTKYRDDVVATTPPADWSDQYARSQRNFVRKWGMLSTRCWTPEMGLLPPKKYDIGLVAQGAALEHVSALEPFCSNLYLDDARLRKAYLASEQSRTLLDLRERVRLLERGRPENEIVAILDMKRFDEHAFALVQGLPDMLERVDGPGVYDLDQRIALTVRNLHTHERELIVNTRCFAYGPGMAERDFR